MPISFATATIGGDIEVPTLSGRVEFPIPEGTQTGKTFRLRNKGIKGLRSAVVGDLFVHVVVETPVKLTDEQKQMLQNFDESLKSAGGKHSPQQKGWFDGVKSFFS
jgi:molecular chaperone DnaJ